MANMAFSLPKLDLEGMTEAEAIRKIQSYLFQLQEQLRYHLTHIDESNMASENTTVPTQQTVKAQSAENIDLSGNEIIKQLQVDVERLKQENSSLQKTLKATERIALVVESMEKGGIIKLSNSAVIIDGGGIHMTTGGKFDVFAEDGGNSYIKFGGTVDEPNFSLGEGGIIKAKKAIIDEIEINNGNLMEAMAGSLASALIVSDTEPQDLHNVVWLQPATASDALDYILHNTAGTPMSGEEPQAETAALTRRGNALPSGAGISYTYGVKVDVYNYAGTCSYHRIKVWAKRGSDGTTLLLHDATKGRVRVGDYFTVNTLDSPITSNENLTNETSITLVIEIDKSDATSARFEKNVDFIVRCTASSGGSSPGAQACTAYYIP